MSFTPAPAPKPSLELLLRDLRVSAEYLERGQADTPLLQQVEALLRPRPPGSLTLILAAPDATRAAQAATWALGISVPDTAFQDPVEILLSDDADAPTGLPEGPYGRPLRLAVANARPTTLVIVALDHGRAHVAALLTRMLSEPTVLVAVTAHDQPIAAIVRETLELLGANCCGHMHAHFQASPGLVPSLSLPGPMLEKIGVIGNQPSPAHLFDARSDVLRVGLSLAARLRRALAVHDMLQDREQTEMRLLQSRQKRDQRVDRAVPVGNDGDARRALEALKGSVAEEFARLAVELRESGRRAGLRNGELLGFLEQLIGNIRPDDLEREEVGRKIRLTLRDSVADELKERFTENLKTLIDADLAAIVACMLRVERNIDEELLSRGVHTSGPRLQRPTAAQLWAPIEEGLHVDVKYRGEMPRRGILQRLGEGRRVIFLFLMMGSLVGGFMGFNIRRAAGMGPVFLVLFFIVVGYTFYSWKVEDKDNLETELAKLKDMLSMDFARLLTDALRERQARLAVLVEEGRREMTAGLDMTQRETVASAAGDAEIERKAARARLKAVEARLRDLQAVIQTSARVRPALERSLFEASAALGATVRPVRPAPDAIGGAA
jgi:hypothetical protein